MQIELNDLPDLVDVVLDPTDSVLVVTDARTDPGWTETTAIDRWRSGLEAVARILDAFRAHRAAVILVDSSPLAPAALVERTGLPSGAAVSLDPRGPDVVLTKSSYDCFHEAGLIPALHRLGLQPCRSQIVVAGTDVAVDCAVRGFRSRQFLVYYPQDAVISACEDDATLAASLTMFHPRACYNIARSSSDRIDFGPDAAGRDSLRGRIDPARVDPDEPLVHAVANNGVCA